MWPEHGEHSPHTRDIGVFLLGAAHRVHDEVDVRPDDLAPGGLRRVRRAEEGVVGGAKHYGEADGESKSGVVLPGEDRERERAQRLDVTQHEPVGLGAVTRGDRVDGRPDFHERRLGLDGAADEVARLVETALAGGGAGELRVLPDFLHCA